MAGMADTIIVSKLYSPQMTFSLPPVTQHTADTNRKQRRALVKAIGHRQFKKLYRKAQA